MSGNKTIPTDQPVSAFIEAIEDPQQKRDSALLLQIMREISGDEPVMWGPGIIGFGQYHYKYDSGREGEMLRIGFSPRKNNLSLYVGVGSEKVKPYLQTLGVHTTGKSCLYIKRLSDIDLNVLKTIIRESYKHQNNQYL